MKFGAPTGADHLTMTFSLERTSDTKITLTVRAPYPELEPLLTKAAENISDITDIEGFRKGKAPYAVVKAKVGEFKILEDASRLYIERKFDALLTEVKETEYRDTSFEPIGEPQVTITKLALGEELEFKITLSLLPALTLPDYRAIAAETLRTKRVPETTAGEVDQAIGWLRESRTKLVTVNRGAATGDRVEIDFSVSAAGVTLEGAGSKNHPLILGRGKFPPGFEEAICGMKAGEEKTFPIAVPPDYRDRTIAGRELEFKTKMNLVQAREVPDWNDEFARTIGNFPSTAAARESVSEGIAKEKEEKERERLRMAGIQAVADAATVEIPAALIERELEKMVAELKSSIGGMGLTFEGYLTHLKKSEADLKREWRGDALRRVKIALVLREIARREKIEPSEEDIQNAIRRTATHRGMSEENMKSLDREAFIRYHVGIARNERVFQWLEQSSS